VCGGTSVSSRRGAPVAGRPRRSFQVQAPSNIHIEKPNSRSDFSRCDGAWITKWPAARARQEVDVRTQGGNGLAVFRFGATSAEKCPLMQGGIQ